MKNKIYLFIFLLNFIFSNNFFSENNNKSLNINLNNSDLAKTNFLFNLMSFKISITANFILLFVIYKIYKKINELELNNLKLQDNYYYLKSEKKALIINTENNNESIECLQNKLNEYLKKITIYKNNEKIYKEVTNLLKADNDNYELEQNNLQNKIIDLQNQVQQLIENLKNKKLFIPTKLFPFSCYINNNQKDFEDLPDEASNFFKVYGNNNQQKRRNSQNFSENNNFLITQPQQKSKDDTSVDLSSGSDKNGKQKINLNDQQIKETVKFFSINLINQQNNLFHLQQKQEKQIPNNKQILKIPNKFNYSFLFNQYVKYIPKM